MINIHLSAVLPNGNEASVGQIYMDYVPRVGEHILLSLHPGYQRMNEQELPRTHTYLFRVSNVTAIACNTTMTELWFTPYSPEVSNVVLLAVEPMEDGARDYLTRLQAQELEDEA